MSDRIDLTQFEEMISGPWRIEWLDGADTDNEEPSAAINTEDYGTIAQTFYRDWDKPYEATTKAIAAVPELIAELKRCYEEIDNLVKEKNRLIDIAERGGAWDGGIDISDINEKYGACNLCGSIPSGCCEEE